MAVQWISYFGYGSLVNRDTRPIAEEAIDVHLRGWKRAWSHRVDSSADRLIGCTSLTVEPDEEGGKAAIGGIDGVLVRIRADDLPELDRREAGYERIQVPASSFDLPADYDAEHVMMYRSLTHNRHLADDGFPILQSYVDCVLVGYQRRFGDEGLQQMVQTTRGWERPILDDRSQPFYPRHVALDAQQQASFDTLLESWRYTCGQ